MGVVSYTGEKTEETVIARPKGGRYELYVIMLLLECIGWKGIDKDLPASDFRHVDLRPTDDVTAHVYQSCIVAQAEKR